MTADELDTAAIRAALAEGGPMIGLATVQGIPVAATLRALCEEVDRLRALLTAGGSSSRYLNHPAAREAHDTGGAGSAGWAAGGVQPAPTAEVRLAAVLAVPPCRDTGHTETIHSAAGCCDPYETPCAVLSAGSGSTDQPPGEVACERCGKWMLGFYPEDVAQLCVSCDDLLRRPRAGGSTDEAGTPGEDTHVCPYGCECPEHNPARNPSCALCHPHSPSSRCAGD